MKKNYVLDANVLLHDPHAVFKFEDNNVIIPIYAIEEIDKFKREQTERGRNARTIARVLDEVRPRGGTLSKPVPMKQGGTLWIALPKTRHELGVGLESNSLDHAILQTAIDIRDRNTSIPTVFVTMDTNLRIRADAIGVTSQTYENVRVHDIDLEQTVLEWMVSPAQIEAFFRDGQLPLEDEALYPNVGVLLRNEQSRNHTALGRYDGARRCVRALRVPREGLMGVRPRNKEQSVALDLLLDDEVPLVSLFGKAGTGKTLLALAAGIARTTVDRTYSRMLVSRPIMPLGRDLGFLPGSVEEKLNPWMQPIFDNLEQLFTSGPSGGRGERDSARTYTALIESGVIQVEPLTYIRGRSLPRQYLIVDEAQNLTPHEVKTIITRSGEGTKVVLTGDPQQIDHPYVDHASNGLSVVAQRFKNERLAGHVTLTKGERSELAELATNLL
ncbi:MAG: PhoH family protein [Deltaproteobacteria bacterium]|nr:PhoH family protein [Deltaproteobacteria bacterium]